VGAAILCEVAGEERLAPYREFARELGLLFQIVDDVLDVAGDAKELGKTAGKDERLAKTTYVSRFGLEGARALAGESHARARARLDDLGGEVASLAAVTDYILLRRS
jgi:geranylgeranyl diphosphate synthase type II